MPVSEGQTIRFDDCVLRTDLGELTKAGKLIRLQDQPLQVLDELLAHAGELVTRQQLIARLWPKGVVDFDAGLNSVVHKLRIALQDEAEIPRYIETVPRKGYRFIGTLVDPPEVPSAVADLADGLPQPADVGGRTLDARVNRSRETRRVYIYAAAITYALAVVAAAVFFHDRTVPVFRANGSPTRHLATPTQTLAILPLHSSGRDEASMLIAQSVTDLIRNRLAAFRDLIVVATSSTSRLTNDDVDVRMASEKLNARFLLKGDAERTGGRLRVAIELIDGKSGTQLWSKTFDRPEAESASIWDEIFGHVADVLRISAPSATAGVPATTASLDGYQLFMRGQVLLAKATGSDAEQAIELFQRATILEPTFAQAYLGLGQALLMERDLRGGRTPEAQARAGKAFDRALALNPGLGEAWIELARLTREPDKAEDLYRKGLELAPNYAAGYVHYAVFLHGNSRAGEAIDVITRARQIDPLTPELHLFHANLLMIVRSDVAEHDRLVREALKINPKLRDAVLQLAYSRWEFSGEFAEAAELAEKAVELDPQWLAGAAMARDAYLDLGDESAAAAMMNGSAPAAMSMEIAQYEANRAGAAALLNDVPPEYWADIGAQASHAEAVRDQALVSGNYGSALRTMEKIQTVWANDPRMWHRGFSLVYAHTLVLAGEVERGRALARSIIGMLDTHSVGRASNFLCRERANAFAILGDDERTLQELALSVEQRKLYRWWYLAKLDPLYAHLRDDPRFRALDEQARKHLDHQRALLEQMRLKGEIPRH